MLFTLLLGDKQARGLARWEVDTMVYGIPSHLFITKQQNCFYSTNLISDMHLTFNACSIRVSKSIHAVG